MEKDHYSFTQAIHQTPYDHSLQRPISPSPSVGFANVLEPEKPINPINSNMAGEFQDSAFGLLSCTESLGSESSEEMTSSLDVCSNSSSNSCCSSNNYRRRESQWRSERGNFPPPLTSLSENGRRNFMLKPVRKDGRLEIVGVMIERPEMLCASRKNGRLRLYLVQTSIREDEDKDGDENEEEEEAEAEEEEEEGEEKEHWRVVTAAASRRCFQMREMHVWGQQHRYVTTM